MQTTLGSRRRPSFLTRALLLAAITASSCAWLGPDPCKLITKAEAEEALQGPVQDPKSETLQTTLFPGAGPIKKCGFTNGNGWLDLAVIQGCELPDDVNSLQSLQGIGGEAYWSDLALFARKNKTCVWVVLGEYRSTFGEQAKLEAKKKVAINALSR